MIIHTPLKRTVTVARIIVDIRARTIRILITRKPIQTLIEILTPPIVEVAETGEVVFVGVVAVGVLGAVD